MGKELRLDDSMKQLSDIIEHAEKMQQRLTGETRLEWSKLVAQESQVLVAPNVVLEATSER